MRRLAWVLFALLAFLAALAAFAPASLLDAQVQDASGGTMRLTAASGTIWRGTGRVAAASGGWSVPVGWTLAPLPLLRGEFDFSLAAPDGMDVPRGRVRVRGDAVRCEQVAFAFPADALRGLFARVPGLKLGGEIAAQADDFAFSGAGGEGRLIAQWRNANVRALGIDAAMGSVTFDAAAAGGKIEARVTNTGGETRVEGILRFAANGVAGDVLFTPLAPASADLFRVLRMVGGQEAGGAVRVRLPNG
jgi:hypothetical protein